MHTRVHLVLLVVALAWACGGSGDPVTPGIDASPDLTADTSTPFDWAEPDLSDDTATLPDTADGTGPADASEILQPGCSPGEGCFLSPCAEHTDCWSGWCVDHMGESVCTVACQSECPPGWSCQLVAGTEPDAVFICVSDVTNLCRPCGQGSDCDGGVGPEDVCVDYGAEGSFCGAPCDADDDCPWGFSCIDGLTVGGVETTQCVAEAGVCPCTNKSVALALSTPCVQENEHGICQGQRVCTDAGLSDCDAPVPAAELCNGLDDDCDGDTDEATCDDGNPCTEDTCEGEDGCLHDALDAGECMDGNPCTIADHCAAGMCVGTPVDCDDGNPCTDDLCDEAGGCLYTDNAATCDDGDPCTLADQCGDGSCQGTPVNCECQSDADCQALEDGDLCNGTLVCTTDALPYTCQVDPATVVDCPGPEGPDAFCLQATCDPLTGACGLAPDHQDFPCDDGDPCTMAETCQDGACGDGATVNCNDGNPCTDDTCDSAMGCVSTPNAAPCSDGDACTLGDTCAGGACVGGAGKSCDDGNPCTTDSCDPATGCVHVPQAGPCDDGNACTTGDACVNGACKGDAALDCDDDDVCTTDSCAPQVGCVHALNEAPCDDDNVCTTGDHCHLGDCIGASQLPCDDGNPCTDDACAPESGCTFSANSAPCDDQNLCTTGEQCSGGACLGGVAPDCDDGNPCTDDLCAPDTGCVHPANTNPCDDGDVCTLGDLCADSACSPGTTMNCDDDNPCTDDACDPDLGCQHEAADGACDDGDACTAGDSCAEGLCIPAEALDCDDTNECTLDGCNPDSGCTHDAVVDFTPCQGGVPWTCVGGQCLCQPQCDGKECGDDACGGTCGTCEEDEECNENTGTCSSGGGVVFGPYTWYLGPRGGNCLGVCEAHGLSCADLVASGWVETCGSNICNQFFPGLGCQTDGDGPRLSNTNPDGSPSGSSMCVYHNWNWGGWSCAWQQRPDDVRFCPCQ